jgi:DNA-directed RNA polymerase specialized sigma24 family protein
LLDYSPPVQVQASSVRAKSSGEAAFSMSGISSSPHGDGVQPFPAPAEAFDALARFADQHGDHYLVLARRWIRWHRLNAVWFPPEDAIGEALVVLCRRIHLGTVQPIPDLAEFRRRFPAALKQVIIDRRRRQHAGKRDARGAVYLSTLVEWGFDKIDEGTLGPEEVASGHEQVRRLLDLLRRHDKRLRAVAVMKMKRYTNAEIAGILRISTATAERMLREIRSILEADGDARK